MAAAVSSKRKAEIFDPVTMGHIRGHGVTRLLVYCESLWCNHSATIEADWPPDDTILRPLGRRMICTACGLIGADVRPDWSQRANSPAAAAAPEGRKLTFHAFHSNTSFSYTS
jgi:hypothetical protein